MSRFSGIPCQPPVYTQSPEHTVAFSTPLFPDITSQSSSNPFIQIPQRTQYLGSVEIRFPTKQGFSQLFNDLGDRMASCPTAQLLDGRLKLGQCFVTDFYFQFPSAERKPKEVVLPWSPYSTLFGIHCESQ